MEMFKPGAGVIGGDGVVRFWGDGTQPIGITSVEDPARMTARVALDRSVASGKFAFAGDRVSILDAAQVIEAQAGRRFEHRSNGSEAELRAALAAAQKDTSDETFYMLDGEITLLVGDEIRTARHAFRVDSETARFLNGYTPASMEALIIERGVPTAERVLPPKDMGPPVMGSVLPGRYGMDALPGPDPLRPGVR